MGQTIIPFPERDIPLNKTKSCFQKLRLERGCFFTVRGGPDSVPLRLHGRMNVLRAVVAKTCLHNPRAIQNMFQDDVLPLPRLC